MQRPARTRRAEPGLSQSAGGRVRRGSRIHRSSRSSSRRRSCSSRSSPRPACSSRAPASPATPASGWSRPSSRRRRSRRCAARPPTPPKFTTSVVPGQTVIDPDGERPQVHDHPGHAVGQPVVDARARATAAASGATVDPAGDRVGHVAGHGRRPQPVQSTTDARRRRPARTPPRPDRSAPRCSTRPGCRSPNIAGVDHRPDVADADTTTTEGCAFFAFLTPGHVHGVGHRGHRRRRPGSRSIPRQTTSVTVGQTASLHVQLRHRGHDQRSRAGRARPRTPATNIPIGIANTSLQPYQRSTRTPPARPSLTPLFPYASGYTVFAGQLHRQQPGRQGHDPQRVLQQPGHVAGHASRPAATSATTVPLYDLPVTVVELARARRSPDATITATETTGYPSPYNAVCTNGGASRQPRRRSASSRPTRPATASTAVPLGHWTITAVVGHEAAGP